MAMDSWVGLEGLVVSKPVSHLEIDGLVQMTCPFGMTCLFSGVNLLLVLGSVIPYNWPKINGFHWDYPHKWAQFP